MARVYAVEPWLRTWAGGDFNLLETASDIRDVDHLCDSLVKDLKKKATGNDGLLVVCADWKPFETSRRYEQNGVRLLKHLRLTPELGELRRMHTIIFSFEPVEELIRRQPGSQVLLSRGVTFLRLPECLDDLKDQTFLSGRTHILADLRGEDLLAAVRADYRPPDSAHQVSNWYGVWQLLKYAAEIAKLSPVSEPPTVAGELRALHNKEAAHLEETMSSDLDKHALLKHAREEQKKLRRCIERRPIIVYLDDEMGNGWDEAVYLAITGESLPDPPPNWFCTELGQLASSENQEADWQTLASCIIEKGPNLILLDLRLLGKFESNKHAGDTSGAKLIKLLRDQARAVPILLMTASNKFWTFQEAFSRGVDGYWSKEGIGEHSPPSRGLPNTISFIKQTRVLLGEDYQTLWRVTQRIDQMESAWNTDRGPWWKSMDWGYPSPPVNPDPPRVTKPDANGVFALLRQIVFMYREYLRLFQLSYSAQNVGPGGGAIATDIWLRSMAVQVGRVIELVHCFCDLEPLKLGSGATIGGRWDKDQQLYQRIRRDWFGQAVYDIRNMAAHVAVGPNQFEPKHLRSTLAALVAWLSVKPECKDQPAFFRDRRLPRPGDFFCGADRYKDLVAAYAGLFGTEEDWLPTR